MAIYHEDIANIELSSGQIFRSFMNHTIGSGDDMANRFGVRVFRDGEPENIGGTCMGLFIRADGTTVTISSGVVSGNVAYVTLPEACYAVEGQFSLAIKCQGSGVTGTLRIVDGVVSRTSTSAAVDPGAIIPYVEDLIDAIDEAVASIPADYSQLWTSLAPEFSTSVAYVVGQYVTYDGGLYRFTAEHPEGTWNSAHVTAVSIGGDLFSLKAGLTPTVQHFYYPGDEPYIDTADKTITFHAQCPFVVNGVSYGYSKAVDTVVEIPAATSPNYYIIFLDLANSSANSLEFITKSVFEAVPYNCAYVGQVNNASMIFSFPFNVNIDGTLYYALGKDVANNSARLDGLQELVLTNEENLIFEKFSGGYIKSYDGEVGSNSSTGYTSYIYIKDFPKIANPIDHVATYQMAFYDQNKSYISGESITPSAATVWVIDVPQNAVYCRLSFYLDVQSSFYAKGIGRQSNLSKLKGKKLGIIGDSISTYSGYIPSGYETFYPRNTVTNVNKTWWKQLLNETGMELCVNASWSGSTISGDTQRADGYVGCSDARVSALTAANGDTPDIIIVWMGINDFGKTNGITCGNYDGTTGVSTSTNITTITDAFGVLLKKLETAYPNAQIFVCRILPEQFASEMAASYANGFPDINPNDSISLPELNEYIEKIASAFGCGVIPMDKCGLTFFNVNTYTGDGLHPNAMLTPKMCEVAKNTLYNFVK